MDYPAFRQSDLGFYVNLALAVSILASHFFLFGPPKSNKSIIVMGVLWGTWLVWTVALGFFSEISFRDVFAGVLCYGAFLFVFLSDLLRYRLGARLTAARGDKWVKEMDYIYLAFGGLGLLISMGQLNAVSDKLNVPSTVGVVAVASALVLRAIKTRAEIGGWSKL